jgi:hypothetical protein
MSTPMTIASPYPGLSAFSAILIVWVLLGWRSPENEASCSGWEVGALAFTAIAITFYPLVPITLDRAT